MGFDAENTEEFGFGDDNNGFDLPDSGTLAEPVATYNVTEQGTTPADDDDGWDEAINHEEEDKAYKATQPPGGWYFVQSMGISQQKPAPMKKFPHIMTRPSARLSGQGVIEVDGKQIKSRISFNISHVLGYKVDYDTGQLTDKLANDYKLYSSAKKAYKAALGVDAPTPRAVVQYLSTYPLKVRTMQGNDGLIVLDLKEVRG